MNPRKLYLESQVNSATPIGLIVLLYDGILRFADTAVNGIRDGSENSRKEAANAIERCTKILMELNTSLSHEAAPELAGRLSGLYEFFMKEFNDALIARQSSKISDCLPLLTELRDAWKEAEFKTQEENDAGVENPHSKAAKTT